MEIFIDNDSSDEEMMRRCARHELIFQVICYEDPKPVPFLLCVWVGIANVCSRLRACGVSCGRVCGPGLLSQSLRTH